MASFEFPNKIKGNWATLLLPLQKDDSIDWVALEEEVDILIEAGSNGIYSNGTAGEFYNQTEQEFDRIQQILSEKCLKTQTPFQIGCSHMSPIVMFNRIHRVKFLNPVAMQVILPDWSVLSELELNSFIESVTAAASPAGIVLYNPPHAKKVLHPYDWERILNKGYPLAGCKTGGGDEKWYAAMRSLTTRFSVFVPGHTLATGLMNGMQGAYSNVACLNPFVAQEWYNSMNSNMESALELEQRIQIFINNCIRPLMVEHNISNQGADKLMAAIGGWGPVSPRLRWPYKGYEFDDIVTLRKIGKGIIPELFPNHV